MNFKKIILFLTLIFILISLSSVNADDSFNSSDVNEVKITDDEILSSDDNDELKEGDDIYAQTMYFNASAESDGDGSKANPYKYVSDARLPYGVTAYFANGEYEITDTIDLYSNDGVLITPPSQVTFYGESTDGVIFKCTNDSAVAFRINNIARLFAYNMTFDHATIENRGTLEAHGIVFKNCQAVDTTASYYPTRNNAFGGAIYSPGSNYYLAYGMKSYLKLYDCLFMNNTAVYGGSIYHKYGDTIIKNTKFYDSYASLYGGVLATDGGEIQIEDCEFVNCQAAGDAGGAIYSKVTNLTVKNSNFTNGAGDFGGAICNLNSNLIIENSNFYNNTAKYEGGAIYAMYGYVVISNSNFEKSTALDGGALFVDNCTGVDISKSSFSKSSAKRYGGTIFSNGKAVNLDDVTLAESTSPIGEVIYHQDRYDYDIGYNSNYKMMMYNSSYNGVLPQKYDLRDYGWVTPVRDQEGGGNCWAFAGIAALESCILKATGEAVDLSEENVKNLIELYSAYGWKEDTNEGGHSEMTWGNLISWIGPVLEDDDPYDDYSTLSTLMNAFMHVQNVYYLPARENALDNDAIKKAIMDYGAVSVLMYADFDSYLNYDEKTASYFLATSTSAYANHAVTVVGWDDNYDKDKFPLGGMAGSNGAWIVKNSWNTDWGDEGYFYVSYYDPVVFEIGEKNVAYTFILNDTVRYNRNYQYDIGGMTDYLYPNVNNQTLYYKNTFTAIGNDILTATSTIFEDAGDYELSVYINDEFKHTQTGHGFAGYNTIPLTNEYQLNSGDKFTIQFKISKTGGASIPICEVITATRLTYAEGISFFSTDGNTWTDLYTFSLDRPDIEHRYASQVACIKAFTKSSGETLKTNLSVLSSQGLTGETIRITATVKDEKNNLINTGYVTFNIDGVNSTVKVSNGYAVLEKVFTNPGTVVVKASYQGLGFEKSAANTTLTITKAPAKATVISAADVQFIEGQSGVIRITLTDNSGKAVSNADVKLSVNSINESKKTNNEGVATFNVNLTAGEYTAVIIFEGNDNYLESSNSFTVNVLNKSTDLIETNIETSYLNYNYGSYGNLNVVLSDKNGNKISNENIILKVNSLSYVAITNSEGIASFSVNSLAIGNYLATVEFEGSAQYMKSSNTLTIRVLSNSQEISDEVSVIYTNDNNGIVYAQIIDNTGKNVINTNVNLTIAGKTYYSTTNSNGIATFKVDLADGQYLASINVEGKTISPATSPIVRIINTQININDTIDAADIKRAYNSLYDFKATFYDINSNPLADKEINFIINGNDYFVKTDEYGVAKLNTKLDVGTYEITMINPSTRAVTTKTLTITARIAENRNINFDYTSSAIYKVRVYADNGQVAGANEIVTLKFNGQTIKVKTDKNGYASYRISALTPKTYSISAEYKGVSVSNTVVVNSILTAKNKVYKISSVKKYAAALKVNGKAIKNKKITFKIKGKVYKAKTNAKGVAQIKINDLLKAGKYKIKITYLKNTIQKTVTVKK